MEKDRTFEITDEYLNSHPDEIFVFGDNTRRIGTAGAAALRVCPNSYGFLTKKFPNNRNDSFYKPDEYRAIYQEEISKLKRLIESSPEKKFLIAKIGGRYANRFRIFNEVIEPQIKEDLKAYNNVTFLW